MSYEPTDQELVIRLKNGDLRALAALDQRHRARTVRLIAQLAKSHEEAEDIYQEAILKVVSHIDSFDHRRSFHNWLHRIAKNQCIDNYRRRKQVEVTQDDEILLRVADDSRDPLLEATDRELQEEIQRAIDALPKRQRSIAKLRLLEGLGYKEIAKQIGGSVQAVKSLFSVARKTLQVKLQFYLSCFAFPWRSLRQRVNGSGVSASTATSVSGIFSVAAHLFVAAVLIYGSMDVAGENNSITSEAPNVLTVVSSADVRPPLPVGENVSRETQNRLNLPSARRNARAETPTPKHRTLEAVLLPQVSTVSDLPSLLIAPTEMGLGNPELIPAIKQIAPSEAFATPRRGEPTTHRSGRAIISRAASRSNPSDEIASLVSQLSLPYENFGQPRVAARENRLQMQASMHAISNSFRRLRAIRSVQEFDAYSLAQLRRVARSVGQYPFLISHCDQANLLDLLAERWTPIVMLRSLVGGTHPWVINSWETDTGKVTLTNPLEQHTKQLTEAAFIEAWQNGTSPSTCLLLAARPLPHHSSIFSSSQKHASALTKSSPRVWH